MATLIKPPNNRLFDSTLRVSPIVQRRMNDQAVNANATLPVSAPVFNISVGDGVLDLFRPRIPVQDTPAPALPPVATHAMVLSPARDIGQDRSIAEFCALYGLQPSIQKKLEDNAYDHARLLRFVSLNNLGEMEFKLGERAALLDAIERWSLPRAI
jgi:hypothetical protein